MIPARWQLYAVVAVAFVLGVLGIRSRWIAEGEEKLRSKIEARNRQARDEAREIANEVEALDRDSLKRRAAIWVRRSDR